MKIITIKIKENNKVFHVKGKFKTNKVPSRIDVYLTLFETLSEFKEFSDGLRTNCKKVDIETDKYLLSDCVLLSNDGKNFLGVCESIGYKQ